jgi:methyltransferase (TIGR00027 family)
MPDPVLRNVSDTAFLIAEHRAIESARPDALFRDPLAAAMSGERGRDIVAKLPRRPMLSWFVAVRTVVIDEYIQAAVAGGVDTVMNLGAGLDTRPFRLDLPASLRWIEVDYPPLLELKERRLSSEAPRCAVERVKMDLADVPARRRLFDEVGERSKNLLVVTEGVLPYLSTDSVGVLADDLAAVKSARGWIVDYFSPRILQWRKRVVRRPDVSTSFRFAPGDWDAFFREHGWTPREKRFLAVEGERLGREPPMPPALRRGLKLLGRLLPRGRRDAMRNLLGYFLLEPAR